MKEKILALLAHLYQSLTMASLQSPFVAALPVPNHLLFEYDADGDAIMFDASTGLPIRYGEGRRRRFDSDDSDDRASKRSRSGSEGAMTPPRVEQRECPGAPKKAPRAPAEDEHEEDGSPRPQFAPLPPSPTLYEVPYPYNSDDEEGWCTSVVVPDLALRLDMRHPRVILNFLRFVHTYNELAPEGEEINIPLIDSYSLGFIVDHPAVKNPPAEFADEVLELRSLLDRYAKW